MARKKATRKFQLTFNNPQTHGFTHERIRSILEQFPGLEYWCMCDETGEQGTPHTHLYMASKNAIQYETIHRRFYGVHVEAANGSHRENRDYIRKEGKWLDDAKHETNHPETFEEWGELPPDKSKGESQADRIMQMVMDGKTNAEILAELPTAYSKLNYIEQARQTLLEAQYKDKWRELSVTYIWGETGAGKTRSIMEQHGYSKVYRVTDYAHPFDNYKGQDVINGHIVLALYHITIVLGVVVLIRPGLPLLKFFLAGEVLTGQADDVSVGVYVNDGAGIFLIQRIIAFSVEHSLSSVSFWVGGMNRTQNGGERQPTEKL